MRINGIFTKYCYNCGNIMERMTKICPHCNEDLTVYKGQDKIKCRYCFNLMPIHANYCKVCKTKNISTKHRRDNEMLAKLKLAANAYEKENYPEKYVERKLSNIKGYIDVCCAYKPFEKAKKMFIKTNQSGILLQTFEFGQEFLSYNDIISCYKIDKEKLKDLFGIDIEYSFMQEKCIVINTIKGNIVLDLCNTAESLLNCIYFHFDNNVVEFSDSFYNALFDKEIFEKYKKITEC